MMSRLLPVQRLLTSPLLKWPAGAQAQRPVQVYWQMQAQAVAYLALTAMQSEP